MDSIVKHPEIDLTSFLSFFSSNILTSVVPTVVIVYTYIVSMSEHWLVVVHVYVSNNYKFKVISSKALSWMAPLA